MNYIDAHVHVWTHDTAHYPLGPGRKKEEMPPPHFPPEELFKHSRPAGVNRINLIQISFYEFSILLTILLVMLSSGKRWGFSNQRSTGHAQGETQTHRFGPGPAA